MSPAQLSRSAASARSAFTLAELVVVVVIIGIVAAIAAPRVSGTSKQAQKDALQSTMTNVRKAMEMYFAEHGSYPGYNPANGLPNNAAFAEQLTQYTDARGYRQTTYGTPYVYGPYLRSPFPSNPFNKLTTVAVILNEGSGRPAPNSTGWIAVLSSGLFKLNGTDSDLTDAGMGDAGTRADLLLP